MPEQTRAVQAFQSFAAPVSEAWPTWMGIHKPTHRFPQDMIQSMVAAPAKMDNRPR